jgi:hypothetical protein
MMILSACGTEDPAAKADAKLRAMSDLLAGAQSFSVNADEQFVTDDSTVANRKMALTVRRPDSFRAETAGDAGTNTTVYDGEKLTILFSDEEVWAVLDAPETIDAAIDMLAVEYESFVFLADLLAASPYDSLVVENMTGTWVKAEIDGTICDHLTYSNEFIEWQVWIPAKGEPLPIKFEIDYKGEEWPFTSFTSSFDGWKLNPAPSADYFSVEIPESFEQIEFAMRSAQ